MAEFSADYRDQTQRQSGAHYWGRRQRRGAYGTRWIAAGKWRSRGEFRKPAEAGRRTFGWKACKGSLQYRLALGEHRLERDASEIRSENHRAREHEAVAWN